MAARRPPNRKALIRAGAAELFIARGYHRVSMADVAEALGITASAVHYHYRTKQELLLQCVLDSVDDVAALIRAADELDTALHSLAALVTGPQRIFAVWEREVRALEDSQRAEYREREAEVAAHFIPLLRAARPELGELEAVLVAWAVFGVFASRARHSFALPRRRDEQLMFRLGSAAAHGKVASTAPPSTSKAPPAAPGAGLRIPRREQLLTEAIRLFDERGFQSVTMADIGEAAGIVASGVYRHFPSKTDLLVAAMNRAGERVRAAADHALTQARDPHEALDLLLRAHVAVSIEHRHLVGILANERSHLAERERTALRRHQADYLDIWVQALGAVLAGRQTTELKIAVRAVFTMIYFVIRSRDADRRQDLPEHLTELGRAVLVRA
ncbi:TetR/AcrR family transcriptional regulator [Streptomyces sp. NPDC056002]|uniref:TetR/AcrR family transcriptional regulator n=1 Tax=Streptomyces sp. NPDC056002 TaxID=3345675 RepID=UPI0035D65765